MDYIIMIKFFLIFAGVWNFSDGIVSIKLKGLGHSRILDFCRAIRSLLGLGLIITGIYL